MVVSSAMVTLDGALVACTCCGPGTEEAVGSVVSVEVEVGAGIDEHHAGRSLRVSAAAVLDVDAAAVDVGKVQVAELEDVVFHQVLEPIPYLAMVEGPASVPVRLGKLMVLQPTNLVGDLQRHQLADTQTAERLVAWVPLPRFDEQWPLRYEVIEVGS